MRNIIKKGLILLCFNLSVQIPAISQITFDSTEVKEIALIFNEHQYLSTENHLLKKQINSLEYLNNLYIKDDSLRKEEINLYKDKIISDEKIINKQKKYIFGASIGGFVLFILGILL